MFKCEFCDKPFTRNDSLKRHLRHSCIYRPTTSSENLQTDPIVDCDNNMPAPKKIKLQDEIKCETCNKYIASSNYSSHLRSLAHKQKCITSGDIPGVQIISSAFQKRIVSYRLTVENAPFSLDTAILIEQLIKALKMKIEKLIKEKLYVHHSLKVNFELFASFIKPAEEDAQPEIKSFIAPYRVVDQATNYEELIQQLIEVLKKKLEEFQVMRNS